MRRTMVAVLALASFACEGSRTETMRSLAEVQEISAQKDSLLKDVTATSAFLADLGRQIGTVRDLKAGKTTANTSDLDENLSPAGRRARVLAQVQEITERLNDSEKRLAQSRQRVTELTGTDAAKSQRLAAFDSTVASFKDIIESQKAQIADYAEQVRALTEENTKLKSDNAQLASTTTMLTSQRDSLTTQRDSLATENNTVYYVAGTKQALIDRHVIEKTGGFLGLGKTQVPARQMNVTAFMPINKNMVTEILFPRADKQYRVITRQNLAALETAPDDHGRLNGGHIRIKDPNAFWASSKYLILIEQ